MNQAKCEPLVDIRRILSLIADYNVLEHSFKQIGPILVHKSMSQDVIIPGYTIVEENNEQSNVPVGLKYYL